MTYQSQPGTLPHRAIEYLRKHHSDGTQIPNAELAEALDVSPVQLLGTLQIAKRAGALRGEKEGARIMWALGDGVAEPKPEDDEPDEAFKRRAKPPAAPSGPNAFTDVLRPRHEPANEPPEDDTVDEPEQPAADPDELQQAQQAQQATPETSTDAGLEPENEAQEAIPAAALEPAPDPADSPIPADPPTLSRGQAVFGWYSDGRLSIATDQLVVLEADEAAELMGFLKKVEAGFGGG